MKLIFSQNEQMTKVDTSMVRIEFDITEEYLIMERLERTILTPKFNLGIGFHSKRHDSPLKLEDLVFEDFSIDKFIKVNLGK